MGAQDADGPNLATRPGSSCQERSENVLTLHIEKIRGVETMIGESPILDSEASALWMIDIVAPSVLRVGGAARRYRSGGRRTAGGGRHGRSGQRPRVGVEPSGGAAASWRSTTSRPTRPPTTTTAPPPSGGESGGPDTAQGQFASDPTLPRTGGVVSVPMAGVAFLVASLGVLALRRRMAA
jgi:hypothetical protein